MASFSPTLKMLVAPEKLTEAGIDAGNKSEVEIALTAAAQKLTTGFQDFDLRDGATFKSESITIIETGETIEDYVALVSSRFKKNGILHLVLEDGNVVAMKFELSA